MIQPCLSEPSRIWTVAQLVPKWSAELFSLAKAVLVMKFCVNINSCHKCGDLVADGNFLVHAAHNCPSTDNARGKMWSDITDKLSVHTSVFLNGLDQCDFTCILLGAPIDLKVYGISETDYVNLIHTSALFWHRCGYLDPTED